MKKIKIMLMFIFFMGVGLISKAQITGTAHDFSAETWTTEICNVCHTPHNAIVLSDAPLWNHELTTATFILYASPTLNATIGQPTASSKLCLSCHDGTVAIDNFGGVTNDINFVGGNALIGTDLSDDHPISFTYDPTLATIDDGLYDPTVQTSGLGNTIDVDMLFGGQLQCASCHDVHNKAGFNSLLILNNDNSALCLTCHNK